MDVKTNVDVKTGVAPSPRKGMLDIPVYMRGLAKLEGIDRIMKLSSNENPLGSSPLAVKAVAEAAQEMHRYPEADNRNLREAIADYFSLNPDLIYCGGGSDQILSLLVQAFADAGDEMVYSENGYMKFKTYALTAGVIPVAAPDDDFCASVDNILAKITDKTRLVMLANPDNPTGSYLPRSEILRLHAGIPEDVLLVLDEAYAEYVNAEDYDVCTDLVENHENVVVSRTFSKIFGLAAARLGWLYGPDSVVDVLSRIELSFPITGSTLAAGLAALEDKAFVEKSYKHNTYWLNWLTEQLAPLDLQIYPSQTNSLLLKFNDSEKSAEAANQYLLGKGIIGRMFGTPALSNCLRISIGLEDEMQALVAALTEFFED